MGGLRVEEGVMAGPSAVRVDDNTMVEDEGVVAGSVDAEAVEEGKGTAG